MLYRSAGIKYNLHPDAFFWNGMTYNFEELEKRRHDLAKLMHSICPPLAEITNCRLAKLAAVGSGWLRHS